MIYKTCKFILNKFFDSGSIISYFQAKKKTSENKTEGKADTKPKFRWIMINTKGEEYIISKENKVNNFVKSNRFMQCRDIQSGEVF